MIYSKTRASVISFLLLVLVVPFAGANAKPIVEVGFVLDTTGSMGPLIEGAKRKIWSIATAIVECSPDAEIRMGLVAYRDIGDDYVTKTYQLTTDIQDLYANLLELKARGGGDWPESVNETLSVAVNKFRWTEGPNVTRILFLVGDAPPHMDYAQDIKYPVVVQQARHKGILINAVQAGGARDTEKVWRDIAQMGHGEYIPIPQDGGKVVIIETPYDHDIMELQDRINRTIVPYGSPAMQQRTEGKVRQLAAAPKSAASEQASYLNKRAVSSGASGEAVAGDGDLVSDVAAGRAKLDAIKDDELPATVRKLAPAERSAYLGRQTSERKALNDMLGELVKKRDRFVTEARGKAPKTADSFDLVVEKTLRAQIAK
jgi:hypothetical protein